VSWVHRFSHPRERLKGAPPSGNGASSFHLWWLLPSPGPFSEVSAVLQVTRQPVVPRLYFWALQVSFVHDGKDLGAGHTGLQWHPGAPAGAVNWGGYYSSGPGPSGDGTLPGTDSSLPPVDGPHTRHFPWSPGHRYRFRVWSPAAGAWRSEVTDLDSGQTTAIRDLLVAATALAGPVVWSEVFANCDDPPTEVRWSNLQAVDVPDWPGTPLRAHEAQIHEAQIHEARSVRLTYQAYADGGCSNTETRAEGDCFVQVTGLPSARRDAPDVLSLPDLS
jgi:hypothetical protein